MNNTIIPYGKQNITKEDIDAVISALQSDYLTQGQRIKEVEDQFDQYSDQPKPYDRMYGIYTP
jgi:dTDP-4-amino-4,6-dideoxygalactose transaminase